MMMIMMMMIMMMMMMMMMMFEMKTCRKLTVDEPSWLYYVNQY